MYSIRRIGRWTEGAVHDLQTVSKVSQYPDARHGSRDVAFDAQCLCASVMLFPSDIPPFECLLEKKCTQNGRQSKQMNRLFGVRVVKITRKSNHSVCLLSNRLGSCRCERLVRPTILLQISNIIVEMRAGESNPITPSSQLPPPPIVAIPFHAYICLRVCLQVAYKIHKSFGISSEWPIQCAPTRDPVAVVQVSAPPNSRCRA